jgi:glycosyltransferase involved in cell wall biosynthesis
MQLKWLHQNARAYVLPSLSEGFGLPGLEAMAHGCPLVSSNATCLPEVYGDAALFFNPNDEEDMALKIERILYDKQFVAELKKREAQQIKKYSWERMAEQTLNVYKRFLD